MESRHTQLTSVDLRTVESLAAYKLLTNLVTPRPIALVSTVSASGVENLAPFSFFMRGGSNPPSLMISPTLNGRGEPKDTLRNIRETGEFVVNCVSRALAPQMNETSRPLAPEESEWDWTQFTPAPGVFVQPARVAESPVQLECRLFTVVEHGQGPNAARYVIGEVLAVHYAEETPSLIARLGGADYLDTNDADRFTLPRPS